MGGFPSKSKSTEGPLSEPRDSAADAAPADDAPAPVAIPDAAVSSELPAVAESVPPNSGRGPVKPFKAKPQKPEVAVAVDEDIVQHAAMLGLSVVKAEDQEFMWIAERAARDLVRPPWVRLIDEQDGRTYYYNGQTKISSWKTPYLEQYKKLLKQKKQAKKQAAAAATVTREAQGTHDPSFTRTDSASRGVVAETLFSDVQDKVVLMAPSLSAAVTRIVQMPETWGPMQSGGPDALDWKLNQKQSRTLKILVQNSDTHSNSGSPVPRSGAGSPSRSLGAASPISRAGATSPTSGKAQQEGAVKLSDYSTTSDARWWFKAQLRCCQIPSIRACLKVMDSKDWENWLDTSEDGEENTENLDMVTNRVLALNLSVNHISSISHGWLSVFPLLRKLDLSFNSLTSLDGVGAAPQLRELYVSNNKLGSYKPATLTRRGAHRDLYAMVTPAPLAADEAHKSGRGSPDGGAGGFPLHDDETDEVAVEEEEEVEEEVEEEGKEEGKEAGMSGAGTGLAGNQGNVLSKGGVERLVRLRVLEAKNNSLSRRDVAVVFSLDSLTSLTLDRNNITSLAGVERLANLTFLSARRNNLLTLTRAQRAGQPQGGARAGKAGTTPKYAAMQGKLVSLLLDHNQLAYVEGVLDALADNPASLQHLSLDHNPLSSDLSQEGAAKQTLTAAARKDKAEAEKRTAALLRDLGIDGAVLEQVVSGSGAGGNPEKDKKAYKWRVLQQLPSLATLDGEEVLERMRREAEDMRHRSGIHESVVRAADEYKAMLDSLDKRKEWSVRALQGQQDQIQSVFQDLVRKMATEFSVTIKEVAETIARVDRESRSGRGAGGVDVATRGRVEGMLTHVQDRQKRHLAEYQKKQSLSRIAGGDVGAG